MTSADFTASAHKIGESVLFLSFAEVHMRRSERASSERVYHSSPPHTLPRQEDAGVGHKAEESAYT